ncbi:MAG: N-acetylmuramoyl-L-alanine amidase [Terriglobales bacterium]
MVVLLLWSWSAFASVHRSEAWARSQFAAAMRLHQALEARPARELTRADYERVVSAYRRVYLELPTSTKADPSVVAVAQLLEEMGRRFSDDEVLRAAIKQYQFLRQQYPGSKARFGALFRIAEIYKEDLHDKERADAAFQDFLRRYPRNQFAEEARNALAEPMEKASLKSEAKAKAGQKPRVPEQNTKNGDEDSSAETARSLPSEPAEAVSDANAAVAPAEETKSRTIRVTGIRHWSTPESMRIAIDLDQAVKFESQRIDHPDRVFFDLFNTRLDPSLAGKSFDIDDNLLKKIRISQFNHTQTRVVLEVNGSPAFETSMLSNPPRLEIVIPGKPAQDAQAQKTPSAIDAENPAETQPDQLPPQLLAETDSRVLPLEKEPRGKTDSSTTATLPKPSSKPCDGDDDSDDCTAQTAKSSTRTTFTTSHGVKKTIVDADEEDAKQTRRIVAKLDVPETKTTDEASPVDTPPLQPKARSRSGKAKQNRSPATPDVREAQPTASGDRSLIRALGLKIGKIVIDPGHGGHDTGTIGPNGLEEKDLVLDVSQRLGKLLVARLGAEVVYTRNDDTFIPLETRTAIANQEGADLFVSVHANSSHDPDARGVETYYLNFNSSPDALEVAARENAVSDKSIHELQDLVKKIALKEKIEESREFAADVEESLHSGLAAKNPGLRDRGVKKAPFIVLIGANMPSILAEISFVSNPGDERKLKKPDYRQKIAESLYRGIAKYVSGLSGVKVASKIEKSEAQ